MAFISKRTTTPFRIIKHDRNSSLSDSRLSLLIHKFLKIGSTNLLQVGNSKHETNRIEDVRFAGTVQTSDGVEESIEAGNNCSGSVGFETFQANFLDVHGEKLVWGEMEDVEER